MVTASWPSKYSVAVYCLPSPTPNWPERTHLQIAARAKPSSTKKRSIFCASCGILEQIAGVSCHVTLSASLLIAVGPSMVRNLSCVISVSHSPGAYRPQLMP